VLLTGLLLPFVVHDRGGSQAARGELAVAGTAGNTTASNLDATGLAVAGTGGSSVTAGPSTTLAGTFRAAANASAAGPGARAPAPTVQAAATPGSAVAGKASGPPIKVGFTLFQVSAAAGIGFVINVDPKQEQQTYQAYVDYVNSTGGINGRKIEAVYSTYDLLDQNSQNASCLALTQDAKVSAVIGGYNFTSADSCVVDQNRTLLFNNNSFTADELYSTGRHVSLFPQANRMMTALAVRLAQDGHLRGKKVGILDDLGGDPDRSVLADLTSAVKANGGEVVRQSVLSADLATGSSQIPVEVSQMHAAGAETVLLIAFGVYNTQFAQEADSQKWAPFYGATDWQAMYTNVATQNMPASFQGASVTTTRTNEERVGMPEPPQAVQCREIYERMTGSKLDVRGSDSYGLAITDCDSVLVFAAVARAAGSELTAASFVAGAQRMGPIPEARWGGGAFGPGKLDLNDQYRISRYSSDCKCWKPATPFSGA
jgi:ABC-type branched-subunit amino acid transport system substrate-binding protein